MTQPKVKEYIEARVRDTGDTMTGDLLVNANIYAGNNIRLYTTSNEGANIKLITPGNNSNLFKIDTNDNLLRIYYSKDSGESEEFNWSFYPSGIFYSTYITTRDLYLKNSFYSDASSSDNKNKSGIYQWGN